MTESDKRLDALVRFIRRPRRWLIGIRLVRRLGPSWLIGIRFIRRLR
jgi:hypothetical protein